MSKIHSYAAAHPEMVAAAPSSPAPNINRIFIAGATVIDDLRNDGIVIEVPMAVDRLALNYEMVNDQTGNTRKLTVAEERDLEDALASFNQFQMARALAKLLHPA